MLLQWTRRRVSVCVGGILGGAPLGSHVALATRANWHQVQLGLVKRLERGGEIGLGFKSRRDDLSIETDRPNPPFFLFFSGAAVTFQIWRNRLARAAEKQKVGEGGTGFYRQVIPTGFAANVAGKFVSFCTLP